MDAGGGGLTERKSTAELIELTGDRYAELYDFAPMAYLSLDQQGNIHECNFAAAALLSSPRELLIKVPLSSLLTSEHRPRLRDFVEQALRKQPGGSTVELQLTHSPDQYIRLFARPRPVGAETTLLFIVMMDVTVERQLETERLGLVARELAKAQQLTIEVAERTRAEHRVTSLLERLTSVRDDERRRLSRELHDELGQQLTALRLTLVVLRQVSGNEATLQQLEIADGIALQLDRDVDKIAWALRPAALDEFGLVPALDTFVRDWSVHHRISADLHAAEAIHRPGTDIENQFYRIVQEALNNIVKHAHATHAVVRVHETPLALHLSIHDNGEGFDTAGAPGAAGMGLVGMRERVALLGGAIDIDSGLGRGTTISVVVPVPRPAT